MDQKNLLIAIVVSVAILFGFQYLFEHFLPHAPPPPPAQTKPAQPATNAGTPGTPGAEAPASAPSAAVAETREMAIADQPRVKINTPRLHATSVSCGGHKDKMSSW